MHVSALLDKSIFQSACTVVIPLVVYEFLLLHIFTSSWYCPTFTFFPVWWLSSVFLLWLLFWICKSNEIKHLLLGSLCTHASSPVKCLYLPSQNKRWWLPMGGRNGIKWGKRKLQRSETCSVSKAEYHVQWKVTLFFFVWQMLYSFGMY